MKRNVKKLLAAVLALGLLTLAGCAAPRPETPPPPSSSPVQTEPELPAPQPEVQPEAPELSTQPQAPVEKPAEKPEEKPVEQPAETPKPAPTPPAEKPEDGLITVSMTIRCDAILDNPEDLTPGKEPLVPEDGLLYSGTDLKIGEGATVWDLLQRETRQAKLHMEFSQSAVYDSVYVEGIGNLYEFDCGRLSGWMYKVNGVFPGHGCSQHTLRDGDLVEWVYTCDMQDVLK